MRNPKFINNVKRKTAVFHVSVSMCRIIVYGSVSQLIVRTYCKQKLNLLLYRWKQTFPYKGYSRSETKSHFRPKLSHIPLTNHSPYILSDMSIHQSDSYLCAERQSVSAGSVCSLSFDFVVASISCGEYCINVFL